MSTLQVNLCGIPAEHLDALCRLLASDARDIVDYADVFNCNRVVFTRESEDATAHMASALLEHRAQAPSIPEARRVHFTDEQPSSTWEQVHTITLKIRPQYLTRLIKIAKGFGVGEHFGSVDVLHVRCTTEELPLREQHRRQAQHTNRNVQLGSEGSGSGWHRCWRRIRAACDGVLSFCHCPSVLDRMSTLEIHTGIVSSCDLSFNHVMCVVLASGLAAVGMLTDNICAVLAAFFISPLMQMVQAVTWGFCIWDRELVFLGTRNMISGAAICMTFGALVGCFLSVVASEKDLTSQLYEGSGKNIYFSINTSQILSRGPPAGNVFVSAIIAALSGVAVALGQSSGIQSALAGVALSLSLLPPVVNAGMMWSLQARFPDMRTKNHYSVAEVGLYSLYLYLTNVACVFVFALLTLKLKRVGGRTLRPTRARGEAASDGDEEDMTEADVLRSFRPRANSIEITTRSRAQTEHTPRVSSWPLGEAQLASNQPNARRTRTVSF